MDLNGSVTVCTTGWGCGYVSKDGKYVKACKKNYISLLTSACLSVTTMYLVMAASWHFA